jgi:hypothetical protein
MCVLCISLICFNWSPALNLLLGFSTRFDIFALFILFIHRYKSAFKSADRRARYICVFKEGLSKD